MRDITTPDNALAGRSLQPVSTLRTHALGSSLLRAPSGCAGGASSTGLTGTVMHLLPRRLTQRLDQLRTCGLTCDAMVQLKVGLRVGLMLRFMLGLMLALMLAFLGVLTRPLRLHRRAFVAGMWLLASFAGGATAWAQGGAAAPVCPADFAFSDGLCRGAPSVCPAGTVLKAGSCTGMPACPVGASVQEGLCTRVPTCQAGFTFNARSGSCTSSPACAGDGKFDADVGRCVQPAQCIPSIAGRRCGCPSGGEYREQGQVCVQGAPTCPAGSRFDAASKACQ